MGICLIAHFKTPFIKLVKNLTIALRDKNKKYLEKAEEFFEEYEFSEIENNLTMISLLLTNFSLLTNTSLEIDKDQYTTHQLINLHASTTDHLKCLKSDMDIAGLDGLINVMKKLAYNTDWFISTRVGRTSLT